MNYLICQRRRRSVCRFVAYTVFFLTAMSYFSYTVRKLIPAQGESSFSRYKGQPKSLDRHETTALEEKNSTQTDPSLTVITSSIVANQSRKTGLKNLYANDFVPQMYRHTTLCGTIHICVMCATTEAVNEAKILIKSVILHARRSDVFFHFVVSEGSEISLPTVFREIRNPFVNISYELVYVPVKKYVGSKMAEKSFRHGRRGNKPRMIFNFGKCYLYEFLKNVDKCIVLDTDVIFGADPAFLWSEAQARLKPPVLIAVTEKGKTDELFNAGVMLHDFSAMRDIKFENLYSMKYCVNTTKEGDVKYACWGEQVLQNGVMKDHPELFSSMTISWDLCHCQQFRNFPFTSFVDHRHAGRFFGIAHFTCINWDGRSAFSLFKSQKRNRFGLLKGYVQDLFAMDYSNLDGMGHVQKVEL